MRLKKKIKKIKELLSTDNDEMFETMENQQYDNYEFTPEHEEIYRLGYFNAISYVQRLFDKIIYNRY